MRKSMRAISFLDVFFGSIGFYLIFSGIFYGLDIWLQSPTILPYPLNVAGTVFIILGLSLSFLCFKTVLALPKKPSWLPGVLGHM